jgi:hypothetical protein
MSKVLAIIAIGISSVAIGLSVWAIAGNSGSLPILQGASGQLETFAVAGTKNATSSAMSYVPVATSTDPLSAEITLPAYADHYDLDLCVVASSTATVVNWKYGFSEDGTNFFGEDNSSTTAQVVSHSNSTTTHSWLVGTTNPVCKRVQVTGESVNNLRIDFSRGVSFSNYMIYSELNAKKIH